MRKGINYKYKKVRTSQIKARRILRRKIFKSLMGLKENQNNRLAANW